MEHPEVTIKARDTSRSHGIRFRKTGPKEGSLAIKSWGAGERPVDQSYRIYDIAATLSPLALACRGDTPGSDPVINCAMIAPGRLQIVVSGTTFGFGDGTYTFALEGSGEKDLLQFVKQSRFY